MIKEAQDQTGQREPEWLDFAEVILRLPSGRLINAWRNVRTPPSRNVTGTRNEMKKMRRMQTYHSRSDKWSKQKRPHRLKAKSHNGQKKIKQVSLLTVKQVSVKTVEINGILPVGFLSRFVLGAHGRSHSFFYR